MANISNYEKQWCEENGITIDDYKVNYSTSQKDKIKSEIKARIEQAKQIEKEAKEAERIAIKEAKQIEKEAIKQMVKKEKEQEKMDARNAKIGSYGDWATGFEFDEKGNIVNTTPNIIYLFENHPDFKDKLCYDSYTNKYIYRKVTGDIYFNDAFYRDCQVLKEKYIKGYHPNQTIDVLKTIATRRTFNSATDMLNKLKWDGVERLETLFIDQLGVDDTKLNREITKQWLVGAIQRLYEPGCQNENMLILTGNQGNGKSSTLKWLAGPFGFDESISISSTEQDYGMKLQNCWICCFDEYAGLTKKEAAEYKNWLSKQIDSFRAPYGRTVEDYPRHNCYCATTNESAFLKDHTGGQERRMWVLKCNSTLEDGFAKYNSRTDKLWRQIMAEAVHIYKNSENFIPYIPKEMYEELQAVQRKYKEYTSDNVGEMLLEILNRPYWLKKNGDVDSVDDLIKQIKNGYSYRPANIDEQLSHLNHISHAAVKRIMKDCLGMMKKHEYMRYALDGHWCVVNKSKRINNKIDKYYIRGKWIDMNTCRYVENKLVYDSLKSVVDDMTTQPDDNGCWEHPTCCHNALTMIGLQD